jgi:hypothetical protein
MFVFSLFTQKECELYAYFLSGTVMNSSSLMGAALKVGRRI